MQPTDFSSHTHLVKLLQVADGGRAALEVGEAVEEVRNQHAKLRAPVANVIDAQHLHKAYSSPNSVRDQAALLQLTSNPTASKRLQMASPMMVDLAHRRLIVCSYSEAHLRCPTCISLAMLGEEKSTMTRRDATRGRLMPYT